jgi:hypothetical protein
MIKRYVMTKELIMLLGCQQLLLLLSSRLFFLFFVFFFSYYYYYYYLLFKKYDFTFEGKIQIENYARLQVRWHRSIPAPLLLLFCLWLSGWEIHCRQLVCSISYFIFLFQFLSCFFFLTWNNDCINVGGRRRNMSARPL